MMMMMMMMMMMKLRCEVAISNVSGTGSVLNNVQSLEKEVLLS